MKTAADISCVTAIFFIINFTHGFPTGAKTLKPYNQKGKNASESALGQLSLVFGIPTSQEITVDGDENQCKTVDADQDLPVMGRDGIVDRSKLWSTLTWHIDWDETHERVPEYAKDRTDLLNPRNRFRLVGARAMASFKPFDFDPTHIEFWGKVQPLDLAIFLLSMALPCIKFQNTWFKPKEGPFVQIKIASDCSSSIGKQSENGGQIINLTPWCFNDVNTVMHEFMHALGVKHEQTRIDRDDFVAIYYENIKPDKKHNFDKVDGKKYTNFGVPYNIRSIMHYSTKAFSKNDQPTIGYKLQGVFKRDSSYAMPNVPGLTQRDVIKLQKLYGCPVCPQLWRCECNNLLC